MLNIFKKMLTTALRFGPVTLQVKFHLIHYNNVTSGQCLKWKNKVPVLHKGAGFCWGRVYGKCIVMV